MCRIRTYKKYELAPPPPTHKKKKVKYHKMPDREINYHMWSAEEHANVYGTGSVPEPFAWPVATGSTQEYYEPVPAAYQATPVFTSAMVLPVAAQPCFHYHQSKPKSKPKPKSQAVTLPSFGKNQKVWCGELDNSWTLRTMKDINKHCQPGHWEYSELGFPFFRRERR